MCAIYNNLSICIYVYVCCDSMWSPNVAECRRRHLRCHCRHNGPVRPIDMIPRIPLSFRNERRHQDHDHDAWMIEIPLRLHQYYLYATTISWINEYANCIHSLRMWVCVSVRVVPWMNKSPIFFIFFVCLSATTKIHFMGNETCTTIYMQPNSVYAYWQREKRGIPVQCLFLFCLALSRFICDVQHICYITVDVLLFFFRLFISILRVSNA